MSDSAEAARETYVWPVADSCRGVDFCRGRHGTFATGGGDATVSIWDPQAKKRLRQYPKYPSPISALEFNSDGSRLAVAFSESDEGGANAAPGSGPEGNGVWVKECGDEIKMKSKA